MPSSLRLYTANTDVWQTRVVGVLLTHDNVFTTRPCSCGIRCVVESQNSNLQFASACHTFMKQVTAHGIESSSVPMALTSVSQSRILIHRLFILYLLHMRITVNTGDAENWSSVISRTQSEVTDQAHTTMTMRIRLSNATQRGMWVTMQSCVASNRG